jgi:hypothetical protein
MACYTFSKLHFKKGVYDESVDATYIITMEYSIDRHKNITKQLKKLQPTKLVYVVFNKGFRKCKKNLPENKTTFDLIHCNLEIFNHSLENKYSNILVLEDDFIIEDTAMDIKHINEINKFCLQHKNQKYTLSLGSVPMLILPYTYNFRKLSYFFGAHAFIYSKTYRLYALENKDDIYKITDWDEYMNFKLCNYSYYKPLITQIFSETENQRNWSKRFGFGLTNIGIWILNKLEMDKKPQPGFNHIYIVSHILSSSIIILFIWLFYKFIKFVLKL